MQDDSQIGIIKVIRAILADVLDIEEEEITEDASLLHDLETDSTDFVEISIQLEEKLGQFFPLEEWYNAEKSREQATFSVKSLAEFLASRTHEE